MNELLIKEDKIEDMIYKIRGKQVMLDSDLAKLYHCKNGTKTINLSVKRNINRFPNDFYFQLTYDEYYSLRFHSETLKSGRGQHKKFLPFVFTEQGVAMLATILRTDVASKDSIDIMRAFVAMEKYISNNLIEQKYINDSFHDRYFIIDNKIFYHCGASINRIGYKTFSITKLSDIDICNSLLNKIKHL